MATFDVDVGGTTYEVDAPDEATAWKWAKATHLQGASKRDIASEIASDPISQGAREAMKPSVIEDLGRQTLMTGRHLLGAFGGDVIADKLSLPRPQNAQERVVGDIARTMAGTAGVASVARQAIPALQGVPQRLAEMLSAAPASQIASAAGAGAGAGLARESGSGPTGQMAAALAGGIAVPVAQNVASGVGRAARNVVDPWLPGGIERAVSRTANEAAGPRRADVLRALQNPDDFVGAPVTAGEAAAKAGSAEFSGLQEVVKGRFPSQYDAIAQGQNQARAEALRSVGQTPATLDAAVAQRGANAAKNYGVAYATQTKANQPLLKLMGNPYIKDELPVALKLAEANGITPKNNLTEFLHYVKIGLDKQLSKTGNDSLSSTQQKAVQDAKTELVAWMAKANPQYDSARASFQTESTPINQMRVGQYLESKLTAPMSEQGAGVGQRAGMYAQAMRDAPGTIKRSTGNPRYEDLSQVLTPDQLAVTRNVGKDLGRSAEQARLGNIGKEKARTLLGDVSPPLPAAGMFSPHYSVLRAISNRLHGRVEGKSLDALAKAMQDPRELARIMQAATPAEKAALAPYLPTAPIFVGANAIGQQP